MLSRMLSNMRRLNRMHPLSNMHPLSSMHPLSHMRALSHMRQLSMRPLVMHLANPMVSRVRRVRRSNKLSFLSAFNLSIVHPSVNIHRRGTSVIPAHVEPAIDHLSNGTEVFTIGGITVPEIQLADR